MNIAAITEIMPLSSLKRFLKNCGSVIASSATLVYWRSGFATSSQLR